MTFARARLTCLWLALMAGWLFASPIGNAILNIVKP